MMFKPTQDRLRQLFHYDPVTGVLFNRVSRGSRARAGEPVGSSDGAGYLRAEVDGKKYRVHSLVWAYVYGEWPEEIDHKNRIRTDNRIVNLRDSAEKNAQNRGLDRRNKSGFKGVRWDASRKKWSVELTLNGCRVFRGRFQTLDSAVKARDFAEKQYGFNV